MRARSKNSIGKLLKARENAGEQVTNAFVLRLIGLEDGASFHDQSQSEESHNTVIPDFFRQNWKLLCLHLFAGERIDARLKIALSPPPHWIAYWYCRKKLPVNLLVVVKRLSVCSVVKKHSLKLSEKSTGSRVAKVWGSIQGAQFAKRDATRRDSTQTSLVFRSTADLLFFFPSLRLFNNKISLWKNLLTSSIFFPKSAKNCSGLVCPP